MYIISVESSAPACVTTDGFDEPQDCSAVAAGQWWRDVQLSSPLFRQRFHLGETHREKNIVYDL